MSKKNSIDKKLIDEFTLQFRYSAKQIMFSKNPSYIAEKTISLYKELDTLAPAQDVSNFWQRNLFYYFGKVLRGSIEPFEYELEIIAPNKRYTRWYDIKLACWGTHAFIVSADPKISLNNFGEEELEIVPKHLDYFLFENGIWTKKVDRDINYDNTFIPPGSSLG